MEGLDGQSRCAHPSWLANWAQGGLLPLRWQVAIAQGKLQLLLLNGTEKRSAHENLHGQQQAADAENKMKLAAALRGVQLLQGRDGADPKLVAMSKVHMLGEVRPAHCRLTAVFAWLRLGLAVSSAIPTCRPHR